MVGGEEEKVGNVLASIAGCEDGEDGWGLWRNTVRIDPLVMGCRGGGGRYPQGRETKRRGAQQETEKIQAEAGQQQLEKLLLLNFFTVYYYLKNYFLFKKF